MIEVDEKNKKKYDTFSITMELEKTSILDALSEGGVNDHNGGGRDKKKKKTTKKFLIAIAIALSMAAIIFIIWANMTYKPQALAELSMISDSKVEVKVDKYINFTPKGKEPKKGMIFYPEAKIKPEAYAPLCREIAEEGYEVVIVPMRLNLATMSQNRAQGVIDSYPNISNWSIAGHGMGGSCASKFASTSNRISGVILLSSFPMDDEIKDIGKKVISIWGSKDGVVDYERLVSSKAKLPADTTYIEIEGGNHSQFGDYGQQNGDNEAIVTSEKQLSKTVTNILRFMKNL
ncbi:MAG: alpha/beta hydrolase [Clostridioides sp.]|nr:alpha/beta hydrolase [Clostridioides sp.]